MTEKPKNCWCGKPAAWGIKQKVPSGEVVIYVCDGHAGALRLALRSWYLVAEGLWLPEYLTMERLQ